MKRHVLALGLAVALSSSLPAQPITQNLQSMSSAASSARLQLASASGSQEQEPAKEQNDKHLSKREKKARKQQQKEEKKRRKQEAKQRAKELRKQEKQLAKERQQELTRENKQIAQAQQKERKREEKEQSKAMKKNGQQSAAQSAQPAPAPPNVATAAAAPPPSPNASASTAPAPPPPNAKADHQRQSAAGAEIKNTAPVRPEETYSREREHETAQVRREHRARAPYRIPVSTAAPSAALAAQRNVSRAIFSQVPNSNVIVLVNNNNQIVLRGSATTPSVRHRLLQLASAAAGGYSIVDQLASEAVSSAAGAATSAAIGGVSDLIHRPSSDTGPYTSGGTVYNGDRGAYGTAYPPNGNSGPYTASAPDTSSAPPYNGGPGPPYGPPTSDINSGGFGSNALRAGLAPGSRGCVNVYNNNQVFLTGETSSQADAERLRQFARQLGGTNANFIDQLGTRSNGGMSSMHSNESTPSSAGASPSFPAPSPDAIVTPGSVVCLGADNYDQVLLTGTVGSPAEFAKVEESVQPILGDDRLVDELTTGTVEVASQASTAGGTSGTATSANAGSATSAAGSAGTIASSSQQVSADASGTTLPISQSEVEQALHSIPSLSNVDAQVTASSVRLAGSVHTADDKQMARDIARQYAPNRDVIDDVTLE